MSMSVFLIFYRNTPEIQFHQHFCQHCPREGFGPPLAGGIIYPQSPGEVTTSPTP